MKSNKKRTQKAKRGLKFFFLLSLSLLCYFSFFSGHYSVTRIADDRETLARLERENALVVRKISEQQEKIALLKDKDPFVMEEKAREKGMVKPGEKIYKYKVNKEE